jgi:hypothetical protein
MFYAQLMQLRLLLYEIAKSDKIYAEKTPDLTIPA